jgi:hypothetical protein
MAGPSNSNAAASGTARSTLVERVAASASFHRSPRLRELLLYLCHSVLKDPHCSISEHHIGVQVFGRPPDYDSSADTIVRVQVSQLRKKLVQYFLSEGREEPLVIELPKGSYVPVFRPREQFEADESTSSPAPGRLSRVALVLGVLLLLAVIGCGWLAYQNGQLRKGLTAGRGDTPALDHFWGQLFPKGRQVQVVVSDANLMMLSDILDRPVTLNDYRFRTYPTDLINTYVKNPEIRALADHITGTHLTPVQEADVIREMSPLSTRYQIPMSVVFARDFRMLPGATENLILLGHKKGNPWVELFEDRMNFRYSYFEEGPARRGTILNRSPLPGERKSYPVEYTIQGYCVIAHLPKPIGEGTALVVFGTDMSSVEAGGHVICDETSMAKLLARLGIQKKAPIPYFEVLLRTKLVVNVVPGFEIIAHRILKP